MTRMRGCMWLAAGLIVALLAGFAASSQNVAPHSSGAAEASVG